MMIILRVIVCALSGCYCSVVWASADIDLPSPSSEMPYINEARAIANNVLHDHRRTERIDQLTQHPSQWQKKLPFAATHKKLPPVMVFVSFSMPEKSLLSWIKQAHRVHATVMIRGLVNNSFKETILRLHEMTSQGVGGISLNPIAFKQFSIERVPAVVVAGEPLSLSHQQIALSDKFDVIYGDVNLGFALRKIAATGRAGRVRAKKLLMSQAVVTHET